MANTKISALTANTNPTGSEELVYAYNNANGKMTLNTMKTFASADSQATLVSGVNIKTINGDSILGSGNIVIQGGGGGGAGAAYDAVVDASGEGDFTSVSSAIAAGNYNIFIKNGTYTESAGWNPYANNKAYLHIVGESESGVQITFPSTVNTINGYLIDMRYNNAADFYMENITFNITLTDSNSMFYRDNGGSNFIVKNCSFTYNTTVSSPTATKHYLFYSGVINNDTGYNEAGRFYSGLYGCYFNTESTKIINICRNVMFAQQCRLYSSAGRIQLVAGNAGAKLYECYIDVYELGGTNEMQLYNCYVNITGNVYNEDGYNIEIQRADNSIINIGTLQNVPAITLGLCTNSYIDVGSYDITGGLYFNGIEGLRSNCRIICGAYPVGYATISCDISASSLTFSGGSRMEGNRFRNTLTSITVNNINIIINGNKFDGTGTMSITSNNNIITSNQMSGMSLSDTATGTQKANNITA